MAEHTAQHDSHEHHSHASMYVKVWAALLVLLVISIVGPMVGETLEMPIVTLITAFGIAFVKAGMVVKFFMHLDLEPKFIWYILSVSLAFMLLFFFAVAPDVMNHEGSNWKNVAAEAEVARGEAAGDPAQHHGAHGDGHGADHGDDHGGDHGGEHKDDGHKDDGHKDEAGGH